ncbi:MAG: RNA recognition motif domain-containing protein [Cyanobacteriota bacterium]
MSVRLYIGNLPSAFDVKELEALLDGVGEGIRFKAVNDRDTGACRGFGFANVDDPNLAEALIAQLNGRDFSGQPLRIEISERRESRSPVQSRDDRRSVGGAPQQSRKAADKVVHADSVEANSPDPRWAGELAKLKSLLANQTVGV